MALSKGRATSSRKNLGLAISMAAVVAYEGGIACVNSSGYATPGAATASLRAVGVFKETKDNSAGNAGDQSIEIERGCHQFKNSSSADAITAADIGRNCFIVDDETVAKTSNGGVRPVAGVIADVDSSGVWVDFDRAVDRRPITLVCAGVSSKASDAASARFISPIAGLVTKISSILNGALATGDATFTGKINGTNITTGAITATQAGSAAGDIDEVTPTAANAVARGDLISVLCGGASTATATANVQVEITPY